MAKNDERIEKLEKRLAKAEIEIDRLGEMTKNNLSIIQDLTKFVGNLAKSLGAKVTGRN